MPETVTFKITLLGSKQRIWRRFTTNLNSTFKQLHNNIQYVMGWYDCHLYEFLINEESIGIPSSEDDMEFTDSAKAKLNKYSTAPGHEFEYTYDFGDSWEHLLKVEKIDSVKEKMKYPVCIGGAMNCPPEDCGGIPGYYELLTIIKNKKHPEHNDMLEWLGDSFDPDYFDIETINRRIKSYL